ncbi:CPBP family intramembrane glutamic endopeptidase [Phytomonospora sp. NPDC050363]|uniref:CPBP family intramembrane glutamic endopeptidase n=1 Tax=Phytomonospora sp. NPDC050363 TaxID=3155642 RepID=UPI0033FC7621
MKLGARRDVSAIVVSLLAAAGYLAAVVVVRTVLAVAADRQGSDVSGSALSQALDGATPAHALWAWVLVDAVVILVFWPAWRGRQGASEAVADRGVLVPVVAAMFGLQLAFLSFGPLLGVDAGWLVVAAPVADGGLSSVSVPVTALVAAAIVHPLAAELLFRGFIAGRMASSGVSAAVAVAVPAVLFAMVQPSVPFAVLGAAFGVVSGILRWRTGSVAASVLAHYALAVAGVLVWAAMEPVETTAAATITAVLGLVSAVVAVWFADRRVRGSSGGAA